MFGYLFCLLGMAIACAVAGHPAAALFFLANVLVLLQVRLAR